MGPKDGPDGVGHGPGPKAGTTMPTGKARAKRPGPRAERPDHKAGHPRADAKSKGRRHKAQGQITIGPRALQARTIGLAGTNGQ